MQKMKSNTVKNTPNPNRVEMLARSLEAGEGKSKQNLRSLSFHLSKMPLTCE